MIISIRELVRRQDMVFSLFGDEIFVRPDLGTKPFTGNILTKTHINSELNSLAHTEVDREQLVIISSKKRIWAEWRFFVFNGEVVTGSQYHEDGELYVGPYVPDDVWDFAVMVAKQYQPESAFVLDIGDNDGKIGVVELNSFSCSGMYLCNKEDIVVNAVETLKREMTDCYE